MNERYFKPGIPRNYQICFRTGSYIHALLVMNTAVYEHILHTGPIFWKPCLLAIEWASSGATSLLNRTRKELEKRSPAQEDGQQNVNNGTRSKKSGQDRSIVNSQVISRYWWISSAERETWMESRNSDVMFIDFERTGLPFEGIHGDPRWVTWLCLS